MDKRQKFQILYFIATISVLIGLVDANAEGVSYDEMGADWHEACASGSNQSPIDIPLSMKSSSANANRLKKNDKLDLIVSQGIMNNVIMKDLGTTYQVPFIDGALAFWDENDELETYQILQFHVHAPSEHTFDGKFYDLEIHFVHKHFTEGGLAVISVQFDVEDGGNQDNDFITALRLNQKNLTGLNIPAMKLFEQLDKSKLYHYQGSLTTPPCSEIVTWIVVHDPQPISSAQLKYLDDKWKKNYTFAHGHGNNRLVQPLNERYVYMRVDPSQMDSSQMLWNSFLLITLFSAILILF
ncbi:UNKNOWN [Stylonychia lemnae]|uniref:carbonic anhydrase n=1 Tax=Stylonychia lemnae TaxID=5949 RepID=A0A077ZSV4_STYLE|nr:UNKNOWN [Stylonychia lemnae]|eukprot:CDW72963.1 UNKNOWN [Stylonychia lemnae]